MPQTHRDELTTAQWCDAIDRFKAGGMLRCSLMGGEPLVRRDVGKSSTTWSEAKSIAP